MIHPQIPSRLFVAGIDTDAGKSVVSALLTLGLNANYWKPVQAGTSPHTDTEWVRQVTGLPDDRFYPESYRLQLPASPHASAAAENVSIQTDKLVIPNSDRTLIIEGAGGLMVPLRTDYLFADWIALHGFATVLVVKTYLGSINHSLLSIEALKSRDIPLFGIIFNDGGRPESESVILEYANAPLLGRVPQLDMISPLTLQSTFNQYFPLLNGSSDHRL